MENLLDSIVVRTAHLYPLSMAHEYLEKPDEQGLARRSDQATVAGAEAFGRLVRFAELSDTGQGRTVSRFVAAVIGVRPFDMYDLRALDIAISDDVLICLDALRWKQVALTDLVPDGRSRCTALCKAKGLIRED